MTHKFVDYLILGMVLVLGAVYWTAVFSDVNREVANYTVVQKTEAETQVGQSQ